MSDRPAHGQEEVQNNEEPMSFPDIARITGLKESALRDVLGELGANKKTFRKAADRRIVLYPVGTIAAVLNWMREKKVI